MIDLTPHERAVLDHAANAGDAGITVAAHNHKAADRLYQWGLLDCTQGTRPRKYRISAAGWTWREEEANQPRDAAEGPQLGLFGGKP